MNQVINLAIMEKGQIGTVAGIRGGGNLRLKLASLGIHTGSKVTKSSNIFTRGPVVIYVGGMEIAIGYKMACKILIKLHPVESDR
ncbi:MAG: ferrous iron transport protein A [Deltaproteobacteria bacterium]|nr:ferrous iron transport protein A [Deltaproteobacteria bacterium]